MAEKVQLGDVSGILLELRFDRSRNKDPDLLWASGRLLVDGEPVIADDDEKPISWTWIDLLEWLGKNWSELLLEQSLPFSVPATSMLYVMNELEKRWGEMPESAVETEEEHSLRFLHRHDLSSAFKGIYFPSVYLLRQGMRMEIAIAETTRIIQFPFGRTVEQLEGVGDGLAKLAENARHPRAMAALEAWHNRQERLLSRVIPLHTGLPPETLVALSPDKQEAFWELDVNNPLCESELMAAARMTAGTVSQDQLKEVLNLIRHTQRVRSEQLDTLTQAMASDFEEEVGKPYDQGHLVANWLRQKLGIADDQPVYPEKMLEEWGIEIQEHDLTGSPLVALACWGPQHGPAIFLNVGQSSIASHKHGRATTLAHEICHLLLDRDRTLPVVDVLNGGTPEKVEKRARAFAAELLLPRSSAADQFRVEGSVQEAVTNLSERFGVSRSLAARQIDNSEIQAALSMDEKRELQTIASSQ